MVYATYSEFNARYATKLTEAEVASHYLPYASSRLEAMLARAFTVPFSSNNLSAKDLTIDLAYLLLLQRSKEPQDHRALAEALEGRVNALVEGREAMLTTSGDTLSAAGTGDVVWGSTARYRTVFDLRDSARQAVDPLRLEDEP